MSPFWLGLFVGLTLILGLLMLAVGAWVVCWGRGK